MERAEFNKRIVIPKMSHRMTGSVDYYQRKLRFSLPHGDTFTLKVNREETCREALERLYKAKDWCNKELRDKGAEKTIRLRSGEFFLRYDDPLEELFEV